MAALHRSMTAQQVRTHERCHGLARAARTRANLLERLHVHTAVAAACHAVARHTLTVVAIGVLLPAGKVSLSPMPYDTRVTLDAQGEETTLRAELAGEEVSAYGLMVTEREWLDVYPYEKWNAKKIPTFCTRGPPRRTPRRRRRRARSRLS